MKLSFIKNGNIILKKRTYNEVDNSEDHTGK